MNKAYLLEDYSEEDGRIYDYNSLIVFSKNEEEARKQADKLSYDSVPEYIDCSRKLWEGLVTPSHVLCSRYDTFIPKLESIVNTTYKIY